jgi:hypothetical protein
MAVRAKTSTTSIPFADYAMTAKEQFMGALKQSQQVTLGLAQALADQAKTLPDLPVPMIDVNEGMTFAFDFASELLSAQRDFAVQLLGTLKPTMMSAPASA